jgi:hypothetical protein
MAGEEMRCDACRFWCEASKPQDVNRFGECRRYALRPGMSWNGIWPQTDVRHWCGEFEAEVATPTLLQRVEDLEKWRRDVMERAAQAGAAMGAIEEAPQEARERLLDLFDAGEMACALALKRSKAAAAEVKAALRKMDDLDEEFRNA